MTTYLRSPEAARRLGVTLNTLYAYVSRGRVHRTLAADGRTSLFDLEEIDALRERSHRGPPEPPPSIDVRIATAVTRLDEDGPSYRGHRVETLLDRSFEAAAELLWTGELPDRRPRWEAPAGVEVTGRAPSIEELIRLALDLDADDPRGDAPDDPDAPDAPDVARRLLAAVPLRFGVAPDPGEPLAAAIARLWIPEPSEALVLAVDRALLLLADHELATSTLAVRVATSVRASATMSIVAGLAAVAGDLHGSASSHVHRLLDHAARSGARDAIARATSAPGADVAGRVPGFGHSIYRLHDPRFAPLMERVRQLPDPDGRRAVVDEVLVEAGASVPKAPNIDLALGALTWIGGLPDDAPLFSIARLAGWTAHHMEELDERPLRFRGLAR